MINEMFNSTSLFFSLPAIAGTLLFLIKMGLMALGGVGGDLDLDVDVDTDLDIDLGSDVDGGDSTAAFQVLSLQTIAAFLMGFGWAGLGAWIGFDLALGPSVLIGAAGGVGLVWFMTLLLKAIYDLHASGNVDITDAAGHEGVVYASVPGAGAGRGKVRVIIDDRDRIYDAVSAAGALATNTRVRVEKVNEDRTLTVAAV